MDKLEKENNLIKESRDRGIEENEALKSQISATDTKLSEESAESKKLESELQRISTAKEAEITALKASEKDLKSQYQQNSMKMMDEKVLFLCIIAVTL